MSELALLIAIALLVGVVALVNKRRFGFWFFRIVETDAASRDPEGRDV